MPNIGNFPVARYPKPLSVPPGAFIPGREDLLWEHLGNVLNNRTSTSGQDFYSPVFLPQGAKVTKLTLYGYRDDLAILGITLWRNDKQGTIAEMASVVADWITGFSSGYDETITYPDIDNDTYDYYVRVSIDRTDNNFDVRFAGAQLEWQ